VTGVSHDQQASAGGSDILWFGQVTSSNTVTVTMWNRGSGPVDLLNGTLRVTVKKA